MHSTNLPEQNDKKGDVQSRVGQANRNPRKNLKKLQKVFTLACASILLGYTSFVLGQVGVNCYRRLSHTAESQPVKISNEANLIIHELEKIPEEELEKRFQEFCAIIEKYLNNGNPDRILSHQLGQWLRSTPHNPNRKEIENSIKNLDAILQRYSHEARDATQKKGREFQRQRVLEILGYKLLGNTVKP